ncbi:peptide chain release factor N(5)-glutamine methyltransferase [uncultured Flavobacterium sp.]|uniref:peptide chain release factor N(5)-glutamine methyltransferase n=1 Tax=uncultured Flavobacterium sp. TaxID=165435 RepID=UPI0030CA2447
MILKEYKNKFIESLALIYDNHEIDSFFYIITEYLHQKKRVDLALNPNFVLTETELEKWKSIVDELKQEKPIQYILGETEFFGLRFFVNEHTLIPRSETEELVELILSNNKRSSSTFKPKILDIGTGSGCIAICLAKHIANAEVYALDVSKKALTVATKNALDNKVEIVFLQQSILKTDDLFQEFDLIVSNPPYVRNLEKVAINKNVLDYEPHLALFVEDTDALLFYRKIAQLALKNLTPSGKLYFEINQYLAKETVDLLKNLGFNTIQLFQDVYGNDRMISCQR